MSNQNRFLLPHTSVASNSATTQAGATTTRPDNSQQISLVDQENNQLSVDTDFDSYWEEEARNPHRNRIRIGRQYQATVPPLLKPGEKDLRQLDDLETLSFCPKKSAHVSNTELDHYFTVAKSLNLFASLVETRSLLGRDVTIADLNHIKHKEGLSLASVIQPVRQSTTVSPQSSQQILASTTGGTQQSPQKSPSTANNDNKLSLSSTSSSPREALSSHENFTYNQPLMKALSHFISLHHPCHHDSNCKKLLKDAPLEDDSPSVVSNLRQCFSKDTKLSRSRSSLKNPPPVNLAKIDEVDGSKDTDQEQTNGEGIQSPSSEDWTREEVELFSKAIEVCGKNFGSIKKEFLPSKSVRSIVEYYYIGSRDVSDSKKKSTQSVEPHEGCSSPEKPLVNNNSQGGGGGPSSSSSGGGRTGAGSVNASGSSSNRSNPTNNDSPNKTLPESNENAKRTSSSVDSTPSRTIVPPHKHLKTEESNEKTQSKNIDARMSVYNFDDEFKEDSPIKFECPKPGTEVRPLKAKPIIPDASSETSEAGNSNVGSLKFFMDGQLVLKLNACQDQQEGNEKCHWVQSGERAAQNNNRQKRYTKRASDRLSQDQSQNGSKSNSIISSNHDDDSKTDDLTADEDSKESANSFTNVTTPRHKAFTASPTPKRSRTTKTETNSHKVQQQHQQPLASPIDYNRLAVNNLMKERNESLNPNQIVNQVASVPWLQANHFAMAAALLGGLPFPTAAATAAASNLVATQQAQQSHPDPVNMAPASRPMDLSLEHNPPKPIQSKPSSRSRSRPKHS